MSGYEQISLELDGPIATIVLDRPDRLNAFTLRMLDELLDALDRVDGDDDVRAAIFTGRGRAFCAGADLTGGTSIFERDAGEFRMEAHADGGGTLARRLLASTKPLIAAVNGPAVGIGLTMTLPMDIRLAVDTARMGFVFARRGLVPETCSSWFLPRIVGIATAAEWVFTGRLFEAQEALGAGLVRSLHPAGELLPAARALASEIAENTSPVAVALSRQMLWGMLAEGTPEAAHEIDSRGIWAMGASSDAREGVSAFLEKRPARFAMRVSTDLPAYAAEWRAAGGVGAFLASSASSRRR